MNQSKKKKIGIDIVDNNFEDNQVICRVEDSTGLIWNLLES